jgi:putative ABC transport system permease protein
MNTVLLDLRSSLRQLRKTPAFTMMVVLMLALGAGAVALMFSVVYSVLLRPLPYPESERLVKLDAVSLDGKGGSVSLPNFLDWRALNHSFVEMAAYAEQGSSLQTSAGDSTHVHVVAATANLFAMLGVQPMLGRTFAGDEDNVGKPCTLVLSSGVWSRRLGSDREIPGKTVRLDGQPCTVIGVMPQGFSFPESDEDLAWITLPPSTASANRGTGYLSVVGRLKPRVTMAQARADLDAVARNLAQAYPDADKDMGINAVSYRDSITGDVRLALWGLIGAVVLVQLIICSNVGNMQLARALGRTREIAVRMALGARKWRIARQLFVENFVLALIGAALGLLMAHWALKLFGRLAGSVLPRATEIQIYPQVWLALFVTAAATAVLFGLAPLLQLRRLDIEGALRANARITGSRGQAWTRDLLVVGQLALAVVLVTGSFVLLRSLYGLLRQDLGFASQRVLIMNTSIVGDRYQKSNLVTAVYGPQLERIRGLPGVENAGLVTYLPLGYGHTDTVFKIAGSPETDIQHLPKAAINAASEGYFETLRIPLLRGRFFDEHDELQAPRVAVVNDSLAQRYFPGQNAVGRQITLPDVAYLGHPLTIVGIVRGSRQRALTAPPQPEIYVPVRQVPPNSLWSQFLLASISTYVVRTAGEPATLTSAVRGAIREVDPEQVLFHVESMDDVVSDFVQDRRLSLVLLSVFAGLALLVAAAGLYAMLAYTVQQRRADIAVRMALGAQRKDILRLIAGRALVLNVLGLGLGILGAALGGRVLSAMFFGARPWDLATLLGTCGILALFTLPAALVPALRAASLDMLAALKMD